MHYLQPFALFEHASDEIEDVSFIFEGEMGPIWQILGLQEDGDSPPHSRKYSLLPSSNYFVDLKPGTPPSWNILIQAWRSPKLMYEWRPPQSAGLYNLNSLWVGGHVSDEPEIRQKFNEGMMDYMLTNPANYRRAGELFKAAYLGIDKLVIGMLAPWYAEVSEILTLPSPWKERLLQAKGYDTGDVSALTAAGRFGLI